jgi:hypothetical protein
MALSGRGLSEVPQDGNNLAKKIMAINKKKKLFIPTLLRVSLTLAIL